MRRFYKADKVDGCLNIAPTLSFEATAVVLGEALGIVFREDQEGKYEEYPAYRAFALGLEIALLASPSPEDDTREVPIDCFQLVVTNCVHIDGTGAAVDLSALIKAQLVGKTGLEVMDDM